MGMIGAAVLLRLCFRAGRYNHRAAGIGGPSYILGEERYHPAGDRVPGKPHGAAHGGGMAAGESPGFAVYDSGPGLWLIKRRVPRISTSGTRLDYSA